jgi:signal transduction histidine kinase
MTSLSPHAWLDLVAAAGQLALFLLAVGRVARSPVAMPLALLSVALFASSFCQLAHEISGLPQWRYLGAAASPVSVALAMHMVLSFVGRRRSLSWLMYLHYAIFGTISANSLLAFFIPAEAAFVASRAWALMLLGLVTPAMGLAVTFLLIHLGRSVGTQEQGRTRLLLLAIAWAAAFAMADLLAELGFSAPRLATLGTLGSNLLVAFVVLRLKLFGRDLATTSAVSAVMIGALAVLAHLALFRLFETDVALWLVGTASVTLALLVVSRRILIARAVGRERMERLATLGRFSAQMAHDLKNPLAALKGAAQYMKEEHAQGRTLDDKGDFLDLIIDQIERLHTVVAHYQRLGRVEPVRQPLRLEDLVKGVLALQQFASMGPVTVRTELAPGLPDCRVDRDLLAGALENLVRNAFEAMPNGGTLTVRAGLEPQGGEAFISVQDTGEGMDARTRERAFDDFYTTKATGSGMGLAFVRRVVEAHGGAVSLTSAEGEGTTVHLSLPLDAEDTPARDDAPPPGEVRRAANS